VNYEVGYKRIAQLLCLPGDAEIEAVVSRIEYLRMVSSEDFFVSGYQHGRLVFSVKAKRSGSCLEELHTLMLVNAIGIDRYSKEDYKKEAVRQVTPCNGCSHLHHCRCTIRYDTTAKPCPHFRCRAPTP
jgi:hypothetical protein